MAGGHIGSALRRLRGLLGAECAGGPTDGELLRRYVLAHDEAAFESLLRRHGPMVLGVCRRLLGTVQDVDDAFQATFLILVRKASSIGDGERIGNWLYGVAYRVAVRARTQAARRHARHAPLTDVAQEESLAVVEQAVRVMLDEEVRRLPARYREAVVACYLEGRTQEETARHLGWPKGTVATRLNRARELLRIRLTRRGFALAGGTLAGLLTQGSSQGALPPALVATTLHAARTAVAGGVLPAAAAELARGVLRQMFLAKTKAFTAAALALALAAGGSTLGLLREDDAAPSPAPSLAPAQAPRAASPGRVAQAGAPRSPDRPEQAAGPRKPPSSKLQVWIIFMDDRPRLAETGLCPCARPAEPAHAQAQAQAVALDSEENPPPPPATKMIRVWPGVWPGHWLVPPPGPRV
jgi:RNA polymerase sigma factor (sigma-70 family)